MNEYDESSAALYDYYAPVLDGDVEFYVEQAQEAGGPVLELGCGTGRITIPVAEAGVSIVGLDLSTDMLAVARRKIASCDSDVQRRVKLVQGDMRDFRLEQRFNLVMIPFRAFLHLLSADDQRSALGCIRDHLVDGGRLVFNIFDPSLEIIAGHFGPLGPAVKKVSEFTHPETGHRFVVWDTRRYELEEQMIDQYFIFEELAEDGLVISKRYSRMTLRYLFRYESQHLLESCGYRIEALYGDFRRGPFRHGGEQVWVTRKSSG